MELHVCRTDGVKRRRDIDRHFAPAAGAAPPACWKDARMRITALAGGVGGARFLRGLLHHLQTLPPDQSSDPSGHHEVTVVGNTGDDITLHGLRVCPDLDTVMYTLGGGIHEGQ